MKIKTSISFVLRVAMTLLLCVLTTATGWAASPSGYAKGDSNPQVGMTTKGNVVTESVTLIGSTEEWNAFAGSVSNSNDYAGKLVKLTADISVNTMVNTWFRGTFDGCGHTITVNTQGEVGALFDIIDGATIQRVIVEGSVSGDYISASIAAESYGNCTIKNCWSNVAIVTTETGWCMAGSIISMVEEGSVDIFDCAFTGSITTTEGGMVGNLGKYAKVNYKGCLFAPSSLTISNSSKNFPTGNGGNLANCYYNSVCAASNLNKQGVDASNMTDEELLAALGDGWIISNGKLVLNMSDQHLAFASISGLQSPYIATSNPFDITYTVTTVDGITLTKGTNFTETITDSNGETVTGGIITPGDYNLTLTGISPYTGTLTKSFEVVFSQDLNLATINGLENYYYWGNDQGLEPPTVTVTDMSGETVSPSYYTVTIRNSSGNIVDGNIAENGTYTLTIEAISGNEGNYTGSKTASFSVYNYPQGLSLDNDFNEDEIGYYYVNMPYQEHKYIFIPESFTTPFKVYDDGGKNGDYSYNCFSYLQLTCPIGCVFLVSGTAQVAEDVFKFAIFDGDPSSTTNEVTLGEHTTGNVMTILLDSYHSQAPGLDLTVKLVKLNNHDLTLATISEIQTPYIAQIFPYDITYTITAVDGVTLTEGTDFTATITDSNGETVTGGITEAGSYTLTITGIDPFEETITRTFEVVSPHDLILATISGIQLPYIAPSAPFDISYTVTAFDGTSLTEDTDFTATITDSDGETVTGGIIAPGSYNLTIKGISPYTGSQTITFEVVFSQDLTLATISGVKNLYYWWNDQGFEPPTVTMTDIGGETVSPSYYSVTVRNNSGDIVNGFITENGNYTLTIEAITDNEGGYWGSQSVSFTVYRCPPGLSVDTDFNEGELGYYYAIIPFSGPNEIVLPNDFTSPFKVYDDGGKNGIAHNAAYCSVYLTLPEGYVARVSGKLQVNNAKSSIYSIVYVPTENPGIYLGSEIDVPLGGYTEGNNLTIETRNKTNYPFYNTDIDLDIILLKEDEPHSISIEDAYAVNFPSDIPSYKFRDIVSLVVTSNLESDFYEALLGCNFSIKDEFGNSIKYKVDNETSTLTFRMPPSDVTITPRLIFSLADNGSNNTTLNTLDNISKIGIKLENRTLWKDNMWNTLCLPFDVDDFSGTPLEGAQIKTLISSSFDNGTLTLNFKDVSTIEAGRPYIFKWNDDNLYFIRSEADWNDFCIKVTLNDSFEGKYVILDADITVSTMVTGVFKGTFDGGGHTLNLNINLPTIGLVAPFDVIENATIRNLRVTGSVNGGRCSAGIVGWARSSDGDFCLIENCWMDASVTSTDSYIGGIIGYGTNAKVVINSCYVTGNLSAPNIGIFYGWGEKDGSIQLGNCVANGTYSSYDNIDLVLKDGEKISIESCYKIQDIGTQGDVFTGSTTDLANHLGASHWMVQDENVALSYIYDDPLPFVNNPLFKNVTISNVLAPVETQYVDFIGSFSPVTLAAGDHSVLYFDYDNTLHYPNAAMTLNSCRGYFQLNNPSATVNAIVLNFDSFDIQLADNADNSNIISNTNGQVYNVTLQGRTLYRDGTWNTLCLPFALADLSGTPLAGAEIKEIDTENTYNGHKTGFDDGTLYLNFRDAGSIEAGHPYIVRWNVMPNLVISTTAEWDAFAEAVNNGTESYQGKTVRLADDISITTMVGTSDHPFCGTFDGAGHTLDANITDMDNYGTAPFRYISDATIFSVKVAGSVTGNLHCAGLVGIASGTNAISQCEVAASVICSGGSHSHCGGILGHGATSRTTITDCLFSGTISGATTATGIIYGWGDNGTHTIVNCLAAGTYTDCNGIDLLKKNEGTEVITNCYKTQNTGSQGTYTTATGSDLQTLLGSGWRVSVDDVVPTTIPGVTNPVFTGVTINSAAPTAVTSQDGRVAFVGNYDPFVIDDSNIDEIIYLGTNNTIGYASAPRTLRAFRAHFVVSAGSANHAAIRQVLFNDGTTTAVIPIAVDVKDAAAAEGWYTIQGIKLNGMPTEKGLYIHNGSKVSIK